MLNAKAYLPRYGILFYTRSVLYLGMVYSSTLGQLST